MKYLKQHWWGEHSIGWAFWINLVALRCALLFAEQLFAPPFITHIEDVLLLAVAYYAVSFGVILPWQIVGVVRTTDSMAPQLGASATILCAQIGIVVMLLPTGVTAFSVFQPLLVERPKEPLWVRLERERAEKYVISLSPDGKAVSIAGIFELGLTRSLKAVLDENPNVREVVLDSDGGFVNQGRAVANLIEARRLDTKVVGHCKSACAIAFMGGSARRLQRGAKIGFHQYHYDDKTAHPLIDLREEQLRDSNYLLHRGVHAEFAARAFQADHEKIWYPSERELLHEGVVTEVLGDVNQWRMDGWEKPPPRRWAANL